MKLVDRRPLSVAASLHVTLLSTLASTLLGAAGCAEEPFAAPPDSTPAADSLEALGERIFRDTNLSTPPGQACATCHDPAHGFTDGRTGSPTSRGAIEARFGRRNTPTAAYLADCPPLHFSEDAGTLIGGLFLDGRAGSLEEQSQKPLLSALEMNNAGPAEVVGKLRAAAYAPDFVRLFGPGSLDVTEAAYDRMAQALAAFERSALFAPFSSKYDLYLAGRVRLTAQEARGLALFNDEGKGNCAACHPSTPPPGGAHALFTDFSYDNIGLPRNAQNPFYALPADLNPDGFAALDRGLGATLRDPRHDGKFRVPTLRNIALTAPYGHNGLFADLRSVVEFYNTRDTDPRWGPSEVPGTVNRAELGDLGLSDDEVADLVAFLNTLTDGYDPATDGASK